METKIRAATEKDAANLLALYAPYVERTAVTFEYTVPSVSDFANRIGRTLTKYPFLAAQQNGAFVGYAYAGPFHERKAYDWACETTIYVRQDLKHTGIGRALYEALEHCLTAQNILNLNACIAYPEKEDEYLTQNSVQFHQHLGYELVGKFHQCGYKFNRWYDMVWMEKHLGVHTEIPAPVKPFQEIRTEIAEKYGII